MHVLLTGGNGFLGSHCLDLLLRQGHKVTATVRTQAKGETLLQAFPSLPAGQLSYTIVADISQPDAFQHALSSSSASQITNDLDAILHVASPYHYTPRDVQRDLIDPAVNGTLGILRAARDHNKANSLNNNNNNQTNSIIKRVVLTSSMSAVINPKNPPSIYRETDFNPIEPHEAHESGVQAYRASKTFAERAAWEFMMRMHDSDASFSLATINPPLILGPVAPWLASLDAVNTSNERIASLLRGEWNISIPPTGSWHWVDVRDVAAAHVAALSAPGAGGRRYLLAADQVMSNADIARIACEVVPRLRSDGRLPPESELKSDLPPDLFEMDTGPSKTVLGIRYRGLRECVIDTIRSMEKVVS